MMCEVETQEFPQKTLCVELCIVKVIYSLELLEYHTEIFTQSAMDKCLLL